MGERAEIFDRILTLRFFFAALRLCVNAAARKNYFTQRRKGAKIRKAKLRNGRNVLVIFRISSRHIENKSGHHKFSARSLKFSNQKCVCFWLGSMVILLAFPDWLLQP